MLIERGDILSFVLLTDRSFATRQPKYCAKILEVFGADSIRCTRTHAKFAVISNQNWNIAIRSSMNLNRNPRFEQFDLDDDPALCEFLKAHSDEMSELLPPGFGVKTRVVDKAFKDSMGGGLSDVYEQSDDFDMDKLLNDLLNEQAATLAEF